MLCLLGLLLTCADCLQLVLRALMYNIDITRIFLSGNDAVEAHICVELIYINSKFMSNNSTVNTTH